MIRERDVAVSRPSARGLPKAIAARQDQQDRFRRVTQMTVPQVLHPFAAPARQPGDYLEIVRGEGCRLWDSEGRTYLDGTASLWDCAAGHGRTEIIEAVHEQMEQLVAYHPF